MVDIVHGLDPAYGVVISGHTHQPYVCDLPDSAGESTLVTSAGSFGRLVTDVDFTLSTRTGRFVSASATNNIVENGVRNADGTWQSTGTPPNVSFVRNPALVDPAAKVIADKYRTAVAPAGQPGGRQHHRRHHQLRRRERREPAGRRDRRRHGGLLDPGGPELRAHEPGRHPGPARLRRQPGR